MNKLNDCRLFFGIPRTTADYDSDNWLFSTVTIFTQGESYKALQELQHQHIGGGHGVWLTFPFDPMEKDKISSDNIDEVVITLAIRPGIGGPAQPSVQCRFELALTFSDGKELYTGYPDPAPQITVVGQSVPKDGSMGVYSWSKSKPFLNGPTLKDGDID